MSEGEPPPSERDATAAVAVMDALYHHQFEATLRPEAVERFYESVQAIAALQLSVGIGEFTIQFFLSEDGEDLADPESVSWLAVHYNFVIGDDDIELETTGMIIPYEDQDLSEIEDIGEAPPITFGWNDIREDFDMSRSFHP